VRVTAVLIRYELEHVVPQLMPEGLEVIVPPAVEELFTVSV